MVTSFIQGLEKLYKMANYVMQNIIRYILYIYSKTLSNKFYYHIYQLRLQKTVEENWKLHFLRELMQKVKYLSNVCIKDHSDVTRTMNLHFNSAELNFETKREEPEISPIVRVAMHGGVDQISLCFNFNLSECSFLFLEKNFDYMAVVAKRERNENGFDQTQPFLVFGDGQRECRDVFCRPKGMACAHQGNITARFTPITPGG